MEINEKAKAVETFRREHGTPSTSKLNQAFEFFRRKVDKITTFTLRACEPQGYQSEDIVTGERFYLSPCEVKKELQRRDVVAENLARDLFAEYRTAVGGISVSGDKIPEWEATLGKTSRNGWIAAAECVIEKYRCLL